MTLRLHSTVHQWQAIMGYACAPLNWLSVHPSGCLVRKGKKLPYMAIYKDGLSLSRDPPGVRNCTWVESLVYGTIYQLNLIMPVVLYNMFLQKHSRAFTCGHLQRVVIV